VREHDVTRPPVLAVGNQQDAAVKVDVMPEQAEQLAPAQPGFDCQYDHRPYERTMARSRSLQQFLLLSRSEPTLTAWRDCPEPQAGCGIGGNLNCPFLAGDLEHVVQDRELLPHGGEADETEPLVTIGGKIRQGERRHGSLAERLA
jgi:hypothetical protein